MQKNNGFSLLELMIVMIILVSVLALSWPNLTKKLRSSEEKMLEHQVLESIEKAKYQALSSGKPLLVLINNKKINIVKFDDIYQYDIIGKKIWVTADGKSYDGELK